jgi:predicted transcriptional regulator
MTMLTLNFLDQKTKKELQKALKTEEHAVTRERILIMLLRNEGKTYDEISGLLGCCKRQVWYWCNNGNPKEIESLRDKRKKGNHRKVTDEYIENRVRSLTNDINYWQIELNKAIKNKKDYDKMKSEIEEFENR